MSVLRWNYKVEIACNLRRRRQRSFGLPRNRRWIGRRVGEIAKWWKSATWSGERIVCAREGNFFFSTHKVDDGSWIFPSVPTRLRERGLDSDVVLSRSRDELLPMKKTFAPLIPHFRKRREGTTTFFVRLIQTRARTLAEFGFEFRLFGTGIDNGHVWAA